VASHPDPDPLELDDLEAVRREVLLDADPAAVWAALASGDGLEGWLADEVELEVRPGATGTVRDAGGSPRPVRVDEVVEGRRLALTWRDEDDRATVVEFALRPDGDAPVRTRLVVVEVPVATLALVAPGADRILAVGSPDGGSHVTHRRGGGATGPTALAGTRAGLALAGAR